MNKRGIYYLLHNGKNSNLKYYIKCYLREHTPQCFFQMRLEHELSKLEKRPDKDDILKRVDYYCKLGPKNGYDQKEWEEKSVAVKHQPMTNQSTYYHDSLEIARYFNGDLRWVLLSGDTKHIPALPSITKSRPLAGDNTNNIILKLDKNRHFLFVDDKMQWRNKKDIAIFRGDVGNPKDGNVKPNRVAFMKRWFGHPMVDAASIDSIEGHPEWQREKMTIGEHLDWFMEGTLIPNYHYIEVKPDFSDLEERLTYYIQHPDEAEAIIRHAHTYVEQFQDKKCEKLVSLLVLKKYFDVTNSAL